MRDPGTVGQRKKEGKKGPPFKDGTEKKKEQM